MNAPTNTNNKIDFRLGRDVEVTRRPSNTLQADFLSLFCKILFHIRLGALEDDLPFGFRGLTK